MLLVQQKQVMVDYTQGHSDGLMVPSRLNAEADHYATSAQKVARYVPTAPLLTFYMDDYTFYRTQDSWIESNIQGFIEQDVARSVVEKLWISNSHRMTTWLYDPHHLPITHIQKPHQHTQYWYNSMLAWDSWQQEKPCTRGEG